MEETLLHKQPLACVELVVSSLPGCPSVQGLCNISSSVQGMTTVYASVHD